MQADPQTTYEVLVVFEKRDEHRLIAKSHFLRSCQGQKGNPFSNHKQIIDYFAEARSANSCVFEEN